MVNSSSSSRNTVFEARLRASGMTAPELAERMNDVLLRRTGRAGDLTDRTIRLFLSGKTRWPQSRQQLALREIFGCTAVELGFIPRSPRGAKEESMQRRAFLASASAAASSLVFPISRRQIGVSDVIRFRSTLDSLSDSDDLEGGNERLEKLALFRAEQALGMSRMSSASPQARAAIHTGAAEAMNYAAWFALESGRTARARRHLTDALAHAGMSGDPAITLFTWVRMSVLSYRLGKGDDAEAAGQRARATPFGRRDPLFFSLCHVRSALAASQMGEKQSALRSLGEAGECLAKAQPRKRPRWIQFYDAAEFNALAANVHLRLGRPQAAEYHFHRTLSLIRPELKRNRSHYTAKLAIAQLRQGEPELACATAERLVHGELPTSARFGEILGTLRGEFAATGSAQARAWLESTPSVAPRRNV